MYSPRNLVLQKVPKLPSGQPQGPNGVLRTPERATLFGVRTRSGQPVREQILRCSI